MIALKNNDVNVSGLSVQILLALMVAAQVYQTYDKPFVITSANDGKHGPKSKHYRGDAVDIRTRHLSADEEINIAHEIAQSLGKDFDVVLESDHLHIEYDPKRRN